MRLALLSIVLVVGCDSQSYDGDYLPGLTIHQAMALVGDKSPQPKPDTDSHTCDNCGGQGWLGDMTNKDDCPDCETVWQQLTVPKEPDGITPIADYTAAQSQAKASKTKLLAILVSDTDQAWLEESLSDPETIKTLSSWTVYAGMASEWSVNKSPSVVVDPPETGEVNPTFIGDSKGSLLRFIQSQKAAK